MKRTAILSLLVIVLASTAFLSIGRNVRRIKSDDRELALLWKDYESAREGDRPQRMMSLLSRIKEVSGKKRDPWDYYKACREYVEVASMRNWKIRDSLTGALHREILEFDEPILSALMMLDGSESVDFIFDYVQSEASRLKRTANREIYDNLDAFRSFGGFDEVLVPLICTDYEYLLWRLSGLGKWRMNGAEERVFDGLRDCVGDVYPKAGFLEWLYADNHVPAEGNARYDEMKRLVSEYEGRAFSLVPLQSLANMEFRLLQDRKASSGEFVVFRDSLLRYEKERKSYHSGMDALIAGNCCEFDMLLNSLCSKVVQVMIDDGKVEIALRNLDKVRLRMSEDDKKIYETVVENKVNSFYVYDTLTVCLPAVDDGIYQLECYDGMTRMGRCTYYKYTLSMALRESADGFGVYVADYQSGRPMSSVDLVLYKGDRVVVEAEDFSMGGFTALPEIMSAKLTEDPRTSGYYLQAEASGPGERRMLSQKMYLSPEKGFSAKIYDSRKAVVMTDCSAFNPGDTVRFKTVVYDVSSEGHMSVAEGEDVTARLLDPQGKVLSEIVLLTNDFGSAAGKFPLQEVKRNGMFSIVIYDEGHRMASRSFRVDEFILPTFDLSFNENEELYLPGDTVKVSGNIRSFSGHGLSSADVTASVFMDGKLVIDSPVAVSPDGSFELEFKADCGEEAYSAGYEVRIKVTDVTGETLEFSRYERVSGSVNMGMQLLNDAEGVINWPSEAARSRQRSVFADDVANVQMEVRRFDGKVTDCAISYEVFRGREIVLKGEAGSGDIVEMDFSALPSGVYAVVAKCSVTDGYGRVTDAECAMDLLRMKSDDKVLNASVENVIRVLPGDRPAVQFGAGNGPVWAVFELFGNKGELLHSEIVYLEGVPGMDGSLVTKTYDYSDTYPDGIRLNVFYFHQGRKWFWTREWQRPAEYPSIPLEITRFTDKALPSSHCTVSLKTSADAEVLASVFDVSTEKIMPNKWHPVRRRVPEVPEIGIRSVCGLDTNGYRSIMSHDDMFVSVEDNAVIGYGSRGGLKKSQGVLESMQMDSAESPEHMPVTEADGEPFVREDFSAAIAFEPFLYPDSGGCAVLDFTVSDKLSSFVVSLFAHDKDMNSSVLRRDMLVSLPVKVSAVTPEYLYQGDRYVLNASVSNDSDDDVSGEVTIGFYDGSDYRNARLLHRDSVQVTVSSGSAVGVGAEIDVAALDILGVMIAFKGQSVSDAIFVAIPVYAAEQTLVEAHSAVLLPGESADSLLMSIRDSFVNVSSIGAEYSETSIAEMLSESLPLVRKADGMDVISQSEAMYVNVLGGALRSRSGADLEMTRGYAEAALSSAGSILACVNADGGFGWFEGMTSSPVVTAVVLERFAGMRDRGMLSLLTENMGEDVLDDYVGAVTAAVRYMDETFFVRNDRPLWYGGLTLLQYMNVRSMYPGVPFDASAIKREIGAKEWRRNVKSMRNLLVPKRGEGWTAGAALAKVQLASALDRLTSSDAGRALALSWGLRDFSRMNRIIDDELNSLCEYAVVHPSGAIYYPNAVMPWRGLLESEAYAHSLICDLLVRKADREMSSLSDGIRIWLMLQKETQKWDDDPGFVDALASVYDGLENVGETKVMALKKRYSKPFHELKASGNGMSVTVRYYKEVPSLGNGRSQDRVELKSGDVLKVGDRVVAEYSLWNQENRSFVRLSVPRAALLRPVEQLSGWEGGWCRPLMSGPSRIAPYCYREVRTDRSLYWMDVLPEENCVLDEILTVVQEGEFVTPVAELECLYAAHYRANDKGGYVFESK